MSNAFLKLLWWSAVGMVLCMFAVSVPLQFSGCTTQAVQQFTTPAQLQADLTSVAIVAKPYLSAAEIADVSSAKAAAISLANGTLPIVQFQQLLANITPKKDAPALSIALAAASVLFGQVYNYYGVGNSQFIAYCNAFVNGLTAAGF